MTMKRILGVAVAAAVLALAAAPAQAEGPGFDPNGRAKTSPAATTQVGGFIDPNGRTGPRETRRGALIEPNGRSWYETLFAHLFSLWR